MSACTGHILESTKWIAMKLDLPIEGSKKDSAQEP